MRSSGRQPRLPARGQRWLLGASLVPALAASGALAQTSAWNGNRFVVDTAGVVGRSDIVLGQPNLLASQAMPLGNGHLGVAVWGADGLTAQLNRDDTMPGRYSPGWLVIPGLAPLTTAADYAGRLDLYDGSFIESGGGMTARAYVQPGTDALIVDVTGAAPGVQQTAQLQLWSGRSPSAAASGSVGTLSETFVDNNQADPGHSNRTFGSLSAITAIARNVSATVTNNLTVTVTFTPNADGSFRIVAAAPHYAGSGDVATLAAAALSDLSASEHVAAWNRFWQRAGLIELHSADGTGEYMENLRTINLYAANAEAGDIWPGFHSGVGNLFSSVQDTQKWDPASWWHWNQRMQVTANISAGLADLNIPYFNLYSANLKNIESWTRQSFTNKPGACFPETMRFNGNGYEYETGPQWDFGYTNGVTCSAHFMPYYNARTISTGAEISHFIWTQYLATRDRNFLARYYPIMHVSAKFLLAYQSEGEDGLLHTSPSNAHETQWDTTDPTTDLAAMRSTFPETIAAEFVLDHDLGLAKSLSISLSKLPDYPRTEESGKLTLLTAAADATGADVIADSYAPSASNHNSENIGLEPVWPWDVVGDTSPLFGLEQRTFAHRPFTDNNDWSFDPIDAARLQLGAQVSANLIALTEKYQAFPNGFANWEGAKTADGEFYVEQTGVVATALAETLVQDYDGIIRVGPAIPPGWDYDGTVYVQGNTKVDVQVRGGVPATVVIEPGMTGAIRVKNPWPGSTMTVSLGGAPLSFRVGGTIVALPVAAGQDLVLTRTGSPSLPFAPVSGAPASTAKTLGGFSIGLPARSG